MLRKPIFHVLCECIHKIDNLSELCQINPNGHDVQAVTIMTGLIITYNKLFQMFTNTQEQAIKNYPMSVKEFNNPLIEINNTLTPYFINQIENAKKTIEIESGNIFKAETMIQREDGKEFTSGVALFNVSFEKLRNVFVPLVYLEGVGKDIIKLLHCAEQLKSGTNQLNKNDFLAVIKNFDGIKNKLKKFISEPLCLELMNEKLLLPLQIRDFKLIGMLENINGINDDYDENVLHISNEERKKAMDDVQKRLNEMIQQKSIMERDLKMKEIEIHDLKKNMREMRSKMGDMENQIKNLNNKCKNYQKNGETDMNNLQEFEQKKKEEMDELRNQVENILKSLREQNKEETAYNELLLEEIEQTRAESSTLKDENCQMKMKIIEMESNYGGINEIQMELTECKSKNEILSRENERLKNDSISQQQVIDELRKKDDDKNTKIEELTFEIEKLKNENQMKQKEIEEKEKSLKTHEEELTSLQTKFTTMRDNYSQQIEENDNLSNQIDILTKKTSEMEIEIENLKQMNQYQQQSVSTNNQNDMNNMNDQNNQNNEDQYQQQNNQNDMNNQNSQNGMNDMNNQNSQNGMNNMNNQNSQNQQNNNSYGYENQSNGSYNSYGGYEMQQPLEPEVKKFPFTVSQYYNNETVYLTIQNQQYPLTLGPEVRPGTQYTFANGGTPINGMPRDLLIVLDVENDGTFEIWNNDDIVQYIIYSKQFQGNQYNLPVTILTGDQINAHVVMQDGYHIDYQNCGLNKPDGSRGNYYIIVKLQ